MQENLFVVIVDFLVIEEKVQKFRELLLENAEQSRTKEAGCIQFDVCQPEGNSNQFFLYELYSDEAAFTVHLESAHFKSFDAEVKSWITEKKIQTFYRVSP